MVAPLQTCVTSDYINSPRSWRSVAVAKPISQVRSFQQSRDYARLEINDENFHFACGTVSQCQLVEAVKRSGSD
jgi:hypothetical protein